MRSSVVFLGPSLSLAEARLILDAQFRPPIERGDIDELLRADVPAAIGIVDGRFLQSFSISPKEVLRGMDAGIRMFGSSSMGALRAAELMRYGMVGVGQVFGKFASGELDADDEVAMVFDQVDYAPLSDPLVNMRIALSAARDRSLISEETKDRFIETARSMYFPERTYRAVVTALGPHISDTERAALQQFFPTAPDAKHEDAIQLLHDMKAYLGSLDA
jgi:hypothetical protein